MSVQVKASLARFAIGTKGVNIREAQNVKGVSAIENDNGTFCGLPSVSRARVPVTTSTVARNMCSCCSLARHLCTCARAVSCPARSTLLLADHDTATFCLRLLFTAR